MKLEITVPPAVPVITLDEARAHLRETDTVEDEYIKSLIEVATTVIENITRRALITRTVKITIPSFPCIPFIELPQAGLQSITSIKYDDSAGVEQTFLDYWTDTVSEPGRAQLKWGHSWPLTYENSNAVRIIYVTGYGAAASAIPTPLRQAVKFLVAHLFSNREPVIQGSQLVEVPMSIQYLALPYRAWS